MTALLPVEWAGYKLNLLDTPGYTDFAGEVKGAARVADCALIAVDSVAGVEVGTELAWTYADEHKLPRMVLIAKMDRGERQLSHRARQPNAVLCRQFCSTPITCRQPG